MRQLPVYLIRRVKRVARPNAGRTQTNPSTFAASNLTHEIQIIPDSFSFIIRPKYFQRTGG